MGTGHQKEKQRRKKKFFQKMINEMGMKVEPQIDFNDIKLSGAEVDQEEIKKAIGVKGIEELNLDSAIQFHCQRAGRCCFGNNIPITPVDIWHMVRNKNIRKLGFWSTTSLLVQYNPAGFIHREVGMPSGFLVFHRLLPNESESPPKCPMSAPLAIIGNNEDYLNLMNQVKENGRPAYEMFWRDGSDPMFQCVLGNERPTECLSYPIGWLSSGENWEDGRFSINKGICLKCFPESFLVKKSTLRQYLLNKGLPDRFRQIILWNSFYNKWMINLDPQSRETAMKMVFDFDRPLLKSGLKPTQLDNYRPKSFQLMLERIKEILEPNRIQIVS